MDNELRQTVYDIIASNKFCHIGVFIVELCGKCGKDNVFDEIPHIIDELVNEGFIYKERIPTKDHDPKVVSMFGIDMVVYRNMTLEKLWNDFIEKR
jgi:hypothetical protein